ncbi:Mast cell protease 1A [Camelus dromedarius]|uniref:Mast cell protease 1A n=1 Tax=Camelus dromedarius TaxID=9838 RepID=A0A5N4E3P5_CAMDR|nr:Mast cell protease 1A [Camelus dromedarius]KAB1278061.1 Mast cell protease 1A [Camelus dromedarius]
MVYLPKLSGLCPTPSETSKSDPICLLQPNAPRAHRQAGMFLLGKIIRGYEAEPHSRPYMAFLQIQTSGNIILWGGFLAREDFVLTAAHCWGSSISITLGAHNILEQEGTQQVIRVRRAIPHPDDDDENTANDVMLLQAGRVAAPVRMPFLCLQLTRKANLTTAVSPIRLPQGKEPVKPGMVCSVAGWGLLGVNKPAAAKLQEAELEVQTDQQCIHHYKHYDATTQICAGNRRNRENCFEGDSGGPLLCNSVAQGIVSFGTKDGTPSSVYTRISSFLYWIQNTMRICELQGPD